MAGIDSQQDQEEEAKGDQNEDLSDSEDNTVFKGLSQSEDD